MTAFKMSPVLMLFKWFSYQLPKNHNIQNLPILRSRYQLLPEHFCENRVILLQTVAKLRCIKLCAIFFLDHSVF